MTHRLDKDSSGNSQVETYAFPLSFAQERLWFLDRLDPDSPAYNVRAVFRLTGELNLNALEQSLNDVVRRHESLRTVFEIVNGNPVQKILPSLAVSLTLVDLDEQPENEREGLLQSLVKKEALQPFDLSHGPLIRARLWRLAPQNHVLALNMHHIVSDGWSMGVLFGELSALYRGYCAGTPTSLPELPIQYADYSVWQRDWLQGENLDRQLSYWRKQLDGISTLQLRTDRPRPAVQTYQGSSQSVDLSAQLSDALKGLSRREGVTLFMTLLASFQVLLSRYCGQSDIAVGTPIAGRTRQEIEGLIGFFVNTLVLRTDLSSNPTFKDLLRQVRETTLEAYTHQDLPFEKLVEELKPQRSLSYSPLFQVMFVLQNAPSAPPDLEGLSVSPVIVEAVTAKFALTLSMRETVDGLRGSLRYRTDLFDNVTMARLASQYTNLLPQIVANPDRRVGMLELRDPADWAHSVQPSNGAQAGSWHSGKAGSVEERVASHRARLSLTASGTNLLTLGEMIAEWATRTPEAIALMAPGRKPLTYARLQAQIESAATHLTALGIRRNDRVALLLPNGPEMAAAFLAVAAVAASAPLNPGYRAEELGFCLSDLRARALIVPAGIDSEAKLVAAARGMAIIELCPRTDAAAGLFEFNGGTVSSSTRAEAARAENIALVLHTSGTTARPKLVPLTHANLVLSARNIQASFALTPSDRGLNVMPLFHIHGLLGALFSSLAAGGSVACAPGFHAPEFIRWLEEFHPTWYTAVPTMHRAILSGAQKNLAVIRQRPLRFIRSCSAPLPRQLKREMETLFQAPVIESYGMTEAAHQIASNPLPPGRRKEGSVGKAAGTEVLIMDEAGNSLPPGVTGEVVVRASTLTPGYENNVAANTATFIGGWFHTGDQGYLDPEGYIFLTGRFKEIINRGGEKISPREVDEILLSHPAVAQAVTFSVPNPVLGEEVAAAIVLREQAAATARELREFAATRLADFKVPRQVAIVDAIPTGPSGKVQRTDMAEKLGLDALDQESTLEANIFAAPKTSLETSLGEIWAQVLRLERVGRDDNFFHLGGDSLLAAQIIARLRTSLQVKISLIAFFDAPTVAGLARVVETAKASRQALQPRPLRQSPGSQAIPLSYAQQSLWFLDQLEPGTLANNRPAALRLLGSINVPALEQSLEEVVTRHEALRTIFPMVGASPMQVIAAAQPVPLSVVDFSVIPAAQRDTRARELAIEEARRPFDLTQGPMLRASLIKMSEQDHILVVIMHHIASDGWSSEVFFRDLAIFYNALATGTSPVLRPLAVQYADFTVWQRERLRGEYLDNLLAYWKQQIGNELPRVQFPNSRPQRGAVQPRHGGRRVLKLSSTATEAIKAFSQRNDVTLFMTLLAAFKTLLYRYTGQPDLIVGIPVAARDFEEFEDVIGDFINLLPLRSNLSGNPSFRGALKRVREATLQAYAHQDLPVAKLAEVLRTERKIDIRGALQLLFNLRNFPSRSVAFAGLQTAPFDFDHGIARFDLSLDITETSDGLSCVFEHDTAVFDGETIARFMGYFQTLLQAIVANPDRSIENLPLQSEAERRHIQEAGNPTGRDIPLQHSIHSLFESQVARKPTATAVVYDGSGLSYAGLNRRANQLAHYLRGLGAGPDTLVGICVERSLEMAVAVMGVLKAGAAYVPLDPQYPAERLVFMLQDSEVKVVLTQQRLLSLLPPHDGRTVVLDEDWPLIARESEQNPDSYITAEHVAYVIYTSGSTGRPKGVLITHGGVVNHGLAVADLFALRPEDRVSQCNSLSFDISVEELFPSLISGATLVLCPSEKFFPGEDFAAWIASEEITVLNLPTAFWHEWVHALETRPRSVSDCLRLVIVGGDKAASNVLARWRTVAGPQVRWFNTYGPTEATVTTTFYEEDSPSADELQLKEIPIGRPIAGAQVYVLDRHLAPVPVGVSGELYIGGAGLARGYLNRSELTGEKFIPNPFSGLPGTRLYGTGDLCRLLPDGNMEFLGRTDHQVKIRGFRIELGEIESVLAQHPAVRESVVLARDDDPEDATSGGTGKRLVAYVVAEPGIAPAIRDLRGFLKAQLPEHMVPPAFVFLEALPVTANGKVDRKALPEPERTTLDVDDNFSAPRTAAEEMLVGIWAEVLKLDNVGVHDNFFDLGGHSLLATQVVSRVSQAFGVALPLRHLFESPTVAGLAERIEDFRHKGDNRQIPAILPVAGDGDLALSFAQQRLWFLDQLEPNSSLYNVPSAQRLQGPLDVVALEQSLNEIVRRHEVLRTSFSMVEGKPVQRIAPSLSLALSLIDLSEFPESKREAEVGRHANEEAQRPFDLERGPLVRSVLLRLGGEDHVLLLTVHHIIFDGWSLGVLFNELSVVYGAFSKGEPSPLEELPIQYRHFAQWQREWLQGDVLDTQLGFWRKQLENVQTLQLPTDRPRPAVQNYRGASQSIELSGNLAEGLKALSRQQDVTLFMTLLAAFQTLLYRYSGQDDIAVGSPIANRNRAEIESLIGFFVNTLIFRNDLSGNPTFRDLLARVRQSSLEAYGHQDLPFEKLVEVIQPERTLSSSPLFQVMFVYQNTPDSSLNLPGVKLSRLKLNSETSKFDLLLTMTERHQSLRATLQYNIDLFDAATIGRMLGHFQTLLEGVVADPARRLSELPLLTVAERNQLLRGWNDTYTALPEASSMHEMFQTQAAHTPDVVAVAFGSERLTYRELNHRAEQLAHRLQKLGVGRGTSVGICMNRSVEMMVGLLAILKAGAAYVPLDPAYPKDRLSFMLKDAQTTVLLTQERLVEDLPAAGARVMCLDRDSQEVSGADAANFDTVTGQDLAYLIYTSGSTGIPKAVAMSHRPLCNLIAWQIKNFTRSAPAKTLQFASLSFDVSFQEIFATWCSGGTLLLISEELRRDAAGLLHFLRDESVERLFLPYVALQQLAEAAAHEEALPTNLREIITAGEQLQISREIANLFKKLKDCTLQNQYGPAESHVVTAYTLAGAPASWPALPAIGRPIANINLAILDRYLNPVPIGVPGDLHIGGAGLADGYLDRRDLTAEKFIPHPFSEEPGSRLYRTGDLVRYLPDGNIQFLGRIDDQVKIRGFRIELREIEVVLAQHSSVRESVVVAREDNPGDRRLVAYVVAAQNSAPSRNELRRFLQEKLPEYMIPAAFVFLDALPLTVNGKVERRALPPPDQSRPDLDESFSAPRTQSEEMLAGLWAEILKLHQIGIHDNFFELGGHSLLATQVVSRVREVFQVELPLRSLFESPTVAGLAVRIEEVRREKRGVLDLPLVAVERHGNLPLSFAQQRLWFLDQMEPGSTVYNMPGAFRLAGRLDIVALERSLNEIVRRHETLRTTFKNVEGSPQQVVAPQLTVPLPVIDLTDRDASDREHEVRRCIDEAGRRVFDLSRGPLVRATLVRLGQEEHVLLLNMHHVVSDGWSMAIFFRELSALYDAYEQGKASPLAELPIQYADYAVWQRRWLTGEVLETQLRYWNKQLENITTLNLPTDRPRPAVQTYHGAKESLVLSKDVTQAIKALSRKQGASLFMTLLAALQILLQRLSGQDDIVLGSPVAGRNRSEIESLIGFFLNTLVLRSSLSGDPTFEELLAQVRGVCLEAYAHQDVPFEKILEELRPERDLSRTPLFQVLLNMVNIAERVKPAGLEIETLSNAEVEAKFDLTIYVREHNGSLHFNWVYNADLFDRERIQEISRQYEKLLIQILEHPTKSVHAYSLSTSVAQEQLPNPTEPLASDWVGSVHDKLAQHTSSFPDRVAIIDLNGSWTYGELDARSNRLANYLLASGIQREEIIAVYAHRSASLPWALLGILKAGAAFLLLDPAYPTLRLIQYVRGAKPRGLISLDAAGRVPTDLMGVLEETILCRVALPKLPGSTGSVFENYSSANPKIEIRPDDLAYVSYTSGSTGEPKGVQGRHGPLSHFLPWQSSHFALTSEDRFSLLSGLSHDPLHREVLTAFWIGATLCIPDPEILGASGKLPQWMSQQRITFAHLTPALGRLLAESAKPESKSLSLRYAFFVGDQLTWADVARLRRFAPKVTSVNYYGSTETQRAVSYHEIPQAEDGRGESIVPVGRGMPGAQLLVLSKARNLAGIAEVGEIYMRSPHLAKGYLGDPGLTKERFLTNPFTGQSQDRIYKTGDLGRYRRDGRVEVLGRTDGQINIRGFRVETGDIEFALSQNPGLREVVVVAREDPDGGNRLIAYIVAAGELAPSVYELRSFVKQRLPDHMVPAAFVFLDSLPLTPNGKTDLKALPAPDGMRPNLVEGFVAPRTPAEQTLAAIWASLLGVNRVGIRDNFFDLGGHSLLAVRLFAEIEKAFNKRPPLAGLFREATIESLASLISKNITSIAPPSVVPIQPQGSKLPFFCVHEFFGDVFCYMNLARHLGEDQPFYALEPRGLDGAGEPFTDVAEMAAYYIEAIQSLQPHGPYALGGLCFGGVIAFEMAQQLRTKGEPVALVALLDSGIKLNCGRLQWWWRFLQNLPLDFHSWLTGCLQLTRRQWLDVLRIKSAAAKERLASLFDPSARANNQGDGISGSLKRLGEVFQFSERHRQVARAQYRALKSYSPQPYDGRLTLFRARMQPFFSSHDPHKGWSRVAAGGMEVRIVPGNHLGMLQEPHVRVLARDLAACLERAGEGEDKRKSQGRK